MCRKICVVLVDRANYARLKPLMTGIQNSSALRLQVVQSGTMVLDRFGAPIRTVEHDGFTTDAEVYCEVEGSVPISMAKSVGMGVIEFSTAFHRLKPDVVVLNGDRYEVLSAAIAAAFMNITIVHLQGGECSGSIDESSRHAITKFSHYHIPATAQAADFLRRMGEHPDTILTTGCPSADLARQLDRHLDASVINQHGSGATIDPAKPYILAVYHPTTTTYGDEVDAMHAVLEALDRVRMPTILLWPNIDAGSHQINKSIRTMRTSRNTPWLRTVINFEPEDYLRVLANAGCAIGNSSSFVRDASYFGVPVVLVGDRQQHRECADNVLRMPADVDAMVAALQQQLVHGPYHKSDLYGDGHVVERIVAHLATLKPYRQKRLSYVYTA